MDESGSKSGQAGRGEAIGRVAMIGTYLPRRCGIATFSNDLLESIARESPGTDAWCIAMNDREEGYRYPDRVKFEINQNRPADYLHAAEYLNASNVDVVSLQHEYGIFGGEDGSHILSLLKRVRMPVVTTLHTVLRDPSPGQRRVLCKIGELSERLVVMAERAVEFLRDIYDIPEAKILHAPHGIPDVPFIDPNFYREKFGVEGKKVVLTFGLLSPGKGIEGMIDALPQVVARHQDVVYIVLGATHPHVQATYGEDYRTTLQRRANQLGVGENVIFHNRFVELKELCEFLGAADVYVTPYLNEAQIVSGTLAYALGAGNAVVSTPYWYAEELLADGRGRLVPFEDPKTLAATICELFENETLRHSMRRRGYLHTRDFIWPKVARRYLRLFKELDDYGGRSTATTAPSVEGAIGEPELPEIKLDHLQALTDDTSIVRHALGTIRDLAHGYSTDDAARALVAVVKCRDLMPSGTGCSQLAQRYLAFLTYALEPNSGRFRTMMSYDRSWLDDDFSEDTQGRVIWALGEMVARAERKGHQTPAVQLFHRAIVPVLEFTSPRAWAFALIGIHAYLRHYSGDTEIKRYRSQISERLMALYRDVADDDWYWPEPYLAYENAHIPHALLLCGQWMFDAEIGATALRSLEWLLAEQTAPEGYFMPIGTEGYFQRDGDRARFDQTPLEAWAMIDACLEAHRMTDQERWLDAARCAFNWFLGDNDQRHPLYDPKTGGCYDSLHAKGVNENQGAEATIAWILSLASLREFARESEVVESSPKKPGANSSDDAASKTPGGEPANIVIVNSSVPRGGATAV